LIGNTLGGKYRIERVLGAGGMGSVYLAEDTQSGQRVAVKVIHGNLPGNVAAIVSRFEREARAAGSIDTEHICRCLDAGSDPDSGLPFMVLELLDGEDLQACLQRLGPLPPSLALRIVAQACLGLAAAHQANVVHRDIKPANIFLAKAGDDRRTVKVLDFGVAKVRRDPTEMSSDTGNLTRTGSMLGSPLYMSPEQARSVKNVDHRSDLWSLGIVLYQALAGRTPYEEATGLGELILALCSDLPPPVQTFAPWVTPEVAAVVDRALRLDMRERFQSAAEMGEAIGALLPDGIALREGMLVSLDPALRTSVATPFNRQPTGLTGSAPGLGGSGPGVRAVTSPDAYAGTVATSPDARASDTTSAGLGATQGGAKQSKPVPVAGIIAASLLVGGVGVYAFTRPSAAVPQAVPSAVVAVAVSVSAPASAAAPASATAAAPIVLPASAAPPPSASAPPAASASASAAAPSASAPRPKPSASAKPGRLDSSQFGGRK
jgi:serine/threonine-protein kinase